MWEISDGNNIRQIIKKIKLPLSIEEAWDFISSPKNLKTITPDYMGFDILTKELPAKMYAGMIISYRVSPVLSIKTKWVTEITHIRDKSYFVDEQRVGPYKLWHHQHRIEAIEGGVLMTDIVTYHTPLGFLGSIANTLFIKKKLKNRFSVAASDQRAIRIDNKAQGTKAVEMIKFAIGILVLVIGFGTLIAGIVGVSNIMIFIVINI